MAEPTTWRRSYVPVPSPLYYGTEELVIVQPGETVLRAYWGLQLISVEGSVSAYPPGSTVTKAGLLWDVSGILEQTAPSPLSQPGADWMDMTFMPWHGNIATSTNVDWYLTATTKPDMDVRAQRKNHNDPGGGNMSLYVCWESAIGNGEIAGWQYTAAASLDVLIGNPQ